MLKKLKLKLLGWENSSYEIYEETYYKHGGSVNMHPDVISFFLKKRAHLNFYHLKRNNEVIAAYFICDDGKIGFNVWRDYPISYDEVVLPIACSEHIYLPEKSNRISGLHKNIIRNGIYAFRSKRKICIVKDIFSAKTVRKRNSEQRKFLLDGGEYIALKEMTARDIAKIYTYLFKKRFSDTVRCYEESKINDFISSVPDLVGGNCLFYNGAPCAIDLVFHAISNKFIYFDVPNGGLDPTIAKFSLGSLLMWKNINDAKRMCDDFNKEMIFSIGLYQKKWDYKLMWADSISTGKTLML
ncbi:Mig-14 family protein [Enterobacter bugandensis]